VLRKLLKLSRLAWHPGYRRGLQHGTAAAIEHENFLKAVPFATLIDAGANKGQFSLAGRAANPTARILAFEPLARAADQYAALFASDVNVHLVRAALGATPGTAEIHLSRRRDSSSLLAISSKQVEIFPGTDEVGTEVIEVATLDGSFDPNQYSEPVLLKIDVQGFELELLKGAERVLPAIHNIYVEVSYTALYDGQPLAADVINWLAQRNFEIAGVYHTSFDKTGRAVQSDIHFRRIARESSALV
jgi:FkbM family methyltransferase